MAGLIASLNYNPGDLIHSQNLFAQVLCRKSKDKLCEFCFQKAIDLKSCKECLSVKYCKKSCQKNDWPDHRLECKYLKNLPEGTLEDIVRLIGKIILKIKGKEWKTITTDVLGTIASFDDLDSHYKTLTENPRKVLQWKEIKELLRKYIGDENLPEDDDLIKIIGKVDHNKFQYAECGRSALGLCFFLGISAFKHECIPNSNWQVTRKRNLKIWAIRKIKKDEEKISISLRSALFSPPETSLECKCTDCSLPYGESVLKKIIDEKRAYSVITYSEHCLGMIEYGELAYMIPCLSEMVNMVLEQQKGVLGDTNALRLKMLATCLNIGGNLSNIMKLEKITRSIFGEYYMELEPIYKVLTQMNTRLGNYTASRFYAQKLKKIQMHDTD